MKPLCTIVLSSLLAASISPTHAEIGNAIPDLKQLTSMTQRFAPTPMKVDISKLSEGDRKALPKLIAAAKILNEIFLDQLWDLNDTKYMELQEDESALGKARLHYFWINKGPWSDLDDNKAFIPDVPPRKPLGANFYPQDMTKEDFERWLTTLSPEQQEQAKGFFTVIRWKEGSNKKALQYIPYSKFFADDLRKAAALMKEAASLTDNASLKKFLISRADAFLSNDYYQSDKDWMDVDAPLDITIGPYETYNDELFGYKAAFEAYINLRDDKETSKLSAFNKHLQEIENNLPLDAQHKNPKLGTGAAIRVVDEIFNAGDAAHGVQTAAFNLPNDEKVVLEKGSKRVMMKNVQEAKFQHVLLPISHHTLSPADLKDVNFDLFFTHILAHELMHGLGPHQIKVNGRDTTPRKELKELDGAIEEAKADVTGLFALQYMMDHAREMGLENILPHDETAQRQLYTTYLASAFRTLRFGLSDAHGKGMAVQFNFLSDRGAFVQQEDGTFRVDMSKVKSAVADLDRKLLTIEAQGDYAGAKKLLDELGNIRPALQKTLDKLHSIPSDIEPIFVSAEQLK